MEVAALRSMGTQRQWACSATETLLFLVGRNLACLLLAAESLLIGLIAEDQRLSVKEGYKKGSRDEENKDARGEGEEADPEDDPVTNGGGGSDDNDDDDDDDEDESDDDDGGDEDDEDEDEDNDEDDEDVRQPPAKKRK
ncbi:hypothetical protein DY000_02011858 [Brassica cretica]|uniref:Phosphopantothenoylcysteine decarboxylase subunit VHS3-like n=1 Tax=Brassica cretica TaxID=69181 RepID=A0ABQ7DAU9_BRACR|nr:hypothetical protein DY000_02011858 [Brassica cretica]